MPDRGVGVTDQPAGTGVAEIRTRERTIGGNTYAEQYVIPISERVPSFKGGCTTYRTLGSAATPQNLFTLENTGASAVLVALRRLTIQQDATAALTAVATQFVGSRPSALPTGGTQLNKVAFDTTMPSASTVIARGANASDGGAATAITATAGTRLWQQFAMRLHTLAGQVLLEDQNAIPNIAQDDPIILRPGEAFLLQAVQATAANNAATNHYIVNAMWEEFTLP